MIVNSFMRAERYLGKGEVVSSILTGSTTDLQQNGALLRMMLQVPTSQPPWPEADITAPNDAYMRSAPAEITGELAANPMPKPDPQRSPWPRN